MGSDSSASEASPVSIERRGVDHVERALGQALGMEGAKLESAIGFLATTGSACPFIGLFGTVWGIMDTFKGIGARGSATLAVVAPGISEALIASGGTRCGDSGGHFLQLLREPRSGHDPGHGTLCLGVSEPGGPSFGEILSP